MRDSGNGVCAAGQGTEPGDQVAEQAGDQAADQAAALVAVLAPALDRCSVLADQLARLVLDR